MFNLFKKVAAEICRWCPQPIGQVDHAPVPLCLACWTKARQEETERFARWCAAHESGTEAPEFVETGYQRLQRQFRKEFMVYMRAGNGPLPTALDAIRDTHEAITDVRELGRLADAAYARKDVKEGDRLSAKQQARIDAISDARTDAISAIKELEKHEVEKERGDS